MHIFALCSLHGSAHGCTWFNAYPSMTIDAELDYTHYEVAPSICDANMSVSLMSTRSASYLCTCLHCVHCMDQHMDAHSSVISACLSMHIDAELGYTHYEVAPSICDADMSVSLISTRSASHLCTYLHCVHCMDQHIDAHSSVHVCRCPSMPSWITRSTGSLH